MVHRSDHSFCYLYPSLWFISMSKLQTVTARLLLRCWWSEVPHLCWERKCISLFIPPFSHGVHLSLQYMRAKRLLADDVTTVFVSMQKKENQKFKCTSEDKEAGPWLVVAMVRWPSWTVLQTCHHVSAVWQWIENNMKMDDQKNGSQWKLTVSILKAEFWFEVITDHFSLVVKLQGKINCHFHCVSAD